MKFSEQYDIGAYLDHRHAGADSSAGSEVNDSVIDRSDRNSAVLLIAFSATLSEDETVTADVNAQHGSESDGSDMEDYDRSGSVSGKVVATGGTGGTTESGVVELPIRLDEAKQYIRSQHTLTLSDAGTLDSAVAMVILAGGSKTPPE